MAGATKSADATEMEEFVEKCLQKLDCQVFKLETEEAKICAVQAVQRVLREMDYLDGEAVVLRIVRHPRNLGRKWSASNKGFDLK